MQNIKLFFSKFTDFNFIFAKNPPFVLDFILFFLIFFALIFLAGILIPFWLKKKYKTTPHKKLASKIQSSLLVFGGLGFILLFFNWQAIPYLACPILTLILFLAFIFWLVYLLVYLKKDFKRELILWQDEVRKMKYLSKKGDKK